MENTTSFETNAEFQADYNPLQENVKQRPYTRPNVEVVDATPIAEPIFTPPTFEELQSGFDAQNSGGQGANIDDRKVWGQSDEDMGSANPYVEQLDRKDQKAASSALADAVLDGYSQLNGFGNKLIQFDANKIEDLMRKGEIDPNITLPINGQNIGILDYVNEYNSQTKDVISVSPEFIDKVRPVLIRVLMKRGIGMTDEQLLAYYFGVDILTKGATIYGLRKQNASLLEALKDMSGGAPRSTPPPSQPTQPTQPTQQYEEPAPQPKREAKQEREYVEPEEVVVKKEEPIQEAIVVDEPIKRSRQRRPAPQFGDEAILQQMEDIAKGDVKPRGRRKK